jgi:DNA-binding NtrC family response regulator
MRPLPRKAIDASAETNQAGNGEATGQHASEKPGVLVVDDDRLVRLLVQLGMERKGFDVWLAANRQEALQQYRTHRASIGVVLLEVRLPGLEGPATLDALHNLNPQVLVCCMTGEERDHEPEDLRRRGAAHVITKPFSMDELANTLGLLMHGVPADLLTCAEGFQ